MKTTYRYDEQTEKGTVIEQSVGEGAEVRKGTEVEITVSNGADRVREVEIKEKSTHLKTYHLFFQLYLYGMFM